jgi:hypothetical protein
MTQKHNSIVKILKDVVLKYADNPEDVARKYSEVYRIGVENGFVAPRVLDFCEDHVVLERIHDIRPIRDFYVGRDPVALGQAVRRSGEVLGHLHVNLPGEGAARWSCPPEFDHSLRLYAGHKLDVNQLPHAVLHGDYSFANIFAVANDPTRIAVIDPCANFGSTFFDWTWGPTVLDVGKMLACLEGQVPARFHLRKPSPKQINALQRSFVEAYRGAGVELDMEAAYAFAYATVVAQFRRRFGALGRMRSTVLYNRMRRNFPLDRKMNEL